MSYSNVNYTQILPDFFQENPFWTDLTNAIGDLINPNLELAIEQLQNIRGVDVEPYFAGLNMQMLGFKVPVLTFTADQYKLLMRNLGKFVQTRGASTQFINFLGYILNTQLTYIPLWADDITDINSLNAIFGTPIWEAGNWFPTSFYDIAVDISAFPNVDSTQLLFLFKVLEPIHLVIRRIIESDAATMNFYFATIGLDIDHDMGLASR